MNFDQKRDRLGEILLSRKLISDKDLKDALEEQKTTKEFLGQILIRRGVISEKEMLTALSEQLDLAYLNYSQLEIDWNVADKFPKEMIVKNRCFPLTEKDGLLTLTVNNPLDANSISECARRMPGCKMKVVLITLRDMDQLIEFYENRKKIKIQKLFE